MLEKTQLDLALAFALETRAAARNQAFALRAAQDGRAQEAAFFRAAAQAQSVAARRLLLILRGKIGGTALNLAEAFERELPERLAGYEDDITRATGSAAGAFKQALEIGRRQGKLYQRLMEGEADSYQVCSICGCLVAGDPPERCPVCGAIREKFDPVN
ncbi:MAG: rubredoxin-like domain-containing protein [Pseudomonadota bacterium]